jgi:hypothetical protein
VERDVSSLVSAKAKGSVCKGNLDLLSLEVGERGEALRGIAGGVQQHAIMHDGEARVRIRCGRLHAARSVAITDGIALNRKEVIVPTDSHEV